jgi:threonine dehydratase
VTSSTSVITLELIRAAHARVAPYVVRTPTIPLGRLSELLGRPVVAKLELLQHSGSFKARGAFNRMLGLSETERRAGIVAVSGGNHGLAVAYVARELGIPAMVVMPSTTPASSIAGARADGAEVVLTETIAEAFQATEREASLGRVLVHPFDDSLVIAGQGTLALELLEDAPEITDVIASIGGGGMISGVSTALAGLRPEIRVWGVETAGADAMSQALAAGAPVHLDAITSIAKTLGAPAVSQRTLDIVRARVEEVVVVPDGEAVRAIELLAERSKIMTEPAAACTWAAAWRLRDRFPPDARIALVLCGGNVSLDDIERWRSELPGA